MKRANIKIDGVSFTKKELDEILRLAKIVKDEQYVVKIRQKELELR